MAETKISLAAKQLSEQVKESMGFWRRFRDEYSQEVSRIKDYVRMSVLQQIWQQKVEYHSKDKCDDRPDDHRFDIQSIKLESCLNQVHEATRLLTEAHLFNYRSDYDSQRHHLVKIQTTGNLVVYLSKKSALNEAACKDLLEELAELEKLVDPRRQVASMLHHSDKDPTHNVADSEEGNVGQDFDRQVIKDMHAENNCRNWVGEQNTS